METTFAIIGDIRLAGTTVLMVEQNARLALRMADRGYVMGERASVPSPAARYAARALLERRRPSTE